MPRLFVALDLPEETIDELARLCQGLPGARWTEPEDFHLTLRFLGEVDLPLFYEIGEALADVQLPPFELELVGLGTFPPRGPATALWVGVRDASVLDPLRRRIDRLLDRLGLPREKRRYVPHVTLARFRLPPPDDRLGSWIVRRALFRSGPFPVSSFNLYSSRLRPEGAEHQIEASYDFVTGVMERV
jgi:2'-5' RNA ligase